MWYVYLLRCSDGTIYTGCTSNIEERLKRHRSKQVHYTKSRLPVEMITYIAFTDKSKTYDFEKYLKSGSGKAFSNKRFLYRTANDLHETLFCPSTLKLKLCE